MGAPHGRQLSSGDESGSFFSSYGASWGGLFVTLPENTDWEHFQIAIAYQVCELRLTGGNQQYRPVAGTVLIDSIGLGDTLVPYQYCQGTSMAAPLHSGGSRCAR